jgi:3-deoxy-7-phosphoheptulonate synthase
MRTPSNLGTASIVPLPSPHALTAELPLPEADASFVAESRRELEAVLGGEDPRALAIVGPCSIHDLEAAREYAERLAGLRARVADDLVVCMRAYFEKPRTTVGWKGLINDPHLDGSCDVAEGLRRARTLLLELAARRLPAATEMLDPLVPPYLADCIAWTAIGARTTESQTHREMASGLGMPVGFKNGTHGELDTAIQAMQAARAPHTCIGIAPDGRACVVRTAGNPHTHVVLRGGANGPNYEPTHVQRASEQLRKAGLTARVLIDCSHGNSLKNHENQPRVLVNAAEQIEHGGDVLGVMLESHLVAGRQDLAPSRPLTYGQSLTDACIDFTTTERLLERLALAARRARARTKARPRATPPAVSSGAA